MGLYGNKFIDEDINLYKKSYDNYYRLYENTIKEYTDLITESIDVDEGYGEDLRPIFVILLYSDTLFDRIAEKVVKDQDYWHSAISFGPALSRCYAFNFGESNANKIKGGLSFESLEYYKVSHPTATMEVSCILVNEEKFKSLQKSLDYFIHNKEKTRFSFINLLYSFIGHKTRSGLKFNLVCSTFVDTLLKSIDVNISKKHTNLVKPDDLKVKKQNKKHFKIFEGNAVDYDINKATWKVENLIQDPNNNYFS